MRDRLSPPRVLLPHTYTQDGWFLQPERRPARLCEGPPFLIVHVGVVVECAPASPYTHSSSTHRFPDQRTPIEATPLSATSAELGLGLGLGLGLDSPSHSSSHALPFFSPPSFQPSPHKPRLVVSHSTCPPLSSSPHAHSFVLGTAVINNNNYSVKHLPVAGGTCV